MKWTAVDEHDALRHEFADRLEVYKLQEWSPAMLKAVIALLDLHFAEGGTDKAPVLELVKPSGNRKAPARV